MLDRVFVELAALQGPEAAHLPGASFAEVVEGIRRTEGGQAAARARVHGIQDDGIAQGTSFPESWVRFLSFTEACLNNAVSESGDGESSEEELPLSPRPPDIPP